MENSSELERKSYAQRASHGSIVACTLAVALATVCLACSRGESKDQGHSGGNAGTGGTTSGGATNGGTTNGGMTSGGATNGGTAGTASQTTGGASATTGGNSGSGGATGGSPAAGGNSTPTGGKSSTGGAAGSNAGGSASTAPGVRFIGRMDQRDAAGPRFAWSGSGVAARFDGTSVGVKLTGNQQYTVVIDGTVRPKLVSMSGTTPIMQGLSAGTHQIELYRRTEANQGEAQFLGFDFGAGQLLSPPAAKARRIELIGDSISCGYGDEGADMNCPFSADTENHYLSYGAIAARNLDAELVTIAWSGKGVVCNYGDDANSCVDPLPSVYDRALPNRADSTWDFSSFQPHAVILNLGTNDLSTTQDPTQSEFETGYKAFVQHIRSKYPDAFILCTNGPMLSGDDLSKVRSYLANIVKSFNDAGDTKVKSFEITPQLAADGYGCDWHPSLATHRKVADQVTSALKSALGW